MTTTSNGSAGRLYGVGLGPGDPDLVTVKIIGHFTFLSGLIGTSPVTLMATTSLQFEPTNCRQ